MPRRTLPGVLSNRAVRRLLEDKEAAWWLTCFAVRREHRGKGIAIALLNAAADYAEEHGASVLDGHPVDIARLQSRPSPSASLHRHAELVPGSRVRRDRPDLPEQTSDVKDLRLPGRVHALTVSGSPGPTSASRQLSEKSCAVDAAEPTERAPA